MIWLLKNEFCLNLCIIKSLKASFKYKTKEVIVLTTNYSHTLIYIRIEIIDEGRRNSSGELNLHTVPATCRAPGHGWGRLEWELSSIKSVYRQSWSNLHPTHKLACEQLHHAWKTHRMDAIPNRAILRDNLASDKALTYISTPRTVHQTMMAAEKTK